MLILEPPTKEGAARFRRGDPVPASPVLARWERAAKLGVDPNNDATPSVTTDADLAERRERLGAVFREKSTLLAPTADGLAAGHLVAVVADADGVILASHGRGLEDPTARIRLVEGARWSENARGTNAIGTALAERAPVGVIGGAHFELRNHGIFCYGHPIFDGFGDLVAVLDVTGPMAHHERAIGDAVRAAAMVLEGALRSVAHAQAGVGPAVERLVRRSTSATLLVEANGQASIINDRALALLGISGPARCENIFGLSFSDLASFASSSVGAPMRFETAAATYRVELDAMSGPGGRAAAIVAHLEPTTDTRARAAAVPAGPPVHAAIDGLLGAPTLAGEPLSRIAARAPSTPPLPPRAKESDEGAPRTREEILTDAVMAAVRASSGNVSAAARRLGVARSTVYRVLRTKT